MHTLDQSLIAGAWAPAAGESVVAVDPATREPLASLRFATTADVDAAVTAAHAAFPAWSARPPSERAAVLYRIRDALRDRGGEFAAVMAREIGTPLWFNQRIGMTFPVRNIELAIEGAEELLSDRPAGASVILREPYGVVAAITPWNAPVHQIMAKVAAALAAGCTIVLKPSEVAAQTARLIGEIVLEAGAPPGVFNMILGGPDIGEALVAHSLVDVVSFTGSVDVGRRVAATAAAGVKKVLLELGGKSATILLDDADLEKVAATIPYLCFANNGQVCVAQSRLLVPRHLQARLEELLAQALEAWKPGPPEDPATLLGPLATAAQFERVRRYIDLGLAEGARLVTGGPDEVTDLAGYFVRPTVFADVTREMTIAREEIFGPVLAVMPYETEEEAVAIANSVPLGLSGGVWSADIGRAEAVARRMRTGQVAINGAPQNLATPFGGYKQSGYGRENGKYGVDEFLQYKVIHGVGSA